MSSFIFCLFSFEIAGVYGVEVPPVPIPNTEVKLFSADGTWRATARESRTLPEQRPVSAAVYSGGVNCFLKEYM